MNILVLSDSELSQDYKSKVAELDEICFPDAKPGQMQNIYFAQSWKHILLFDDDLLISYLRLILRPIIWQNEKVLVGGIGSVATRPDFRGRGFALQVVRRGLRELRIAKADIGLLQTDVEKAMNLYGKAGFIPADIPYTVFNSTGNLRTIKAKDVMIAPICNQVTFEKIIGAKEALHIGSGDW